MPDDLRKLVTSSNSTYSMVSIAQAEGYGDTGIDAPAASVS